MGRALVSFALPVVLALLFWRIARRSQGAATATFFIVFGLMVVGQLVQFGTRAQAQARMRAFKQDSKRIEAEQRAAIEKGGKLDPKRADEMLRRASDQMRDMVETSSSSRDRVVAEAGQALMQAMIATKKNYDAAVADLGGQAFWRFSTLTTKEEIAKRRAPVKKFMAVNDALAKLQDPAGSGFRRELEARQVPAASIDKAVAGYVGGLGNRGPVLAKIRDSDRRLAVAMLEFLDLAEANLGKWNFKSDTKTLVFEDDSAAHAYREILTRVAAVGAEQARYRKEIVGAEQ